jgi:glycosyltransferase involved in cell wall biosynthesis
MTIQRIVAFFQHMPPYSGAAALRGKSIMQELANLAEVRVAEISVYTSIPSPLPIAGVQVLPLGTPEVENSLSLKRRLLGELHMGWVAAQCLFAKHPRPDLAVISSPGYIAALVMGAVARWHRIPYVLELRDIYPQVYAEAELICCESLLYRFFAKRSRKLYRGARLVIAATQGLASEVRKEVPEANVNCVYNGFPGELMSRAPVKHERFTVCFHGVLGFFQDVATLLEVAERILPHGVDVVVIGYGRKEEPLQKTTLSNVRFLGRQPFDETIKQVERCHLGLCLRLDDNISKDAFPVKVWEYMGLGIPSVITPPCEAGDFVAEHGCGLVHESGDVDAIVSTILTLKAEPARIDELSARCRIVASRYTREQTGLAAAQLIAQAAAETLAAS